MADTDETTLQRRVRERLEATGKSMHAVSISIGANPGYVRDMLDPAKASRPTADRLAQIARELETTTEYLLGESNNAEQVRSEVSLADRTLDWRGPAPEEPGIPLVGTGDCAALELPADGGTIAVERSSFDPDFHVRMLARPPALRGARHIYAIYFHGESMEPRFEAGEIGIVDPNRPVRAGDYVVVQLSENGDGEVSSVLVKRLVRTVAGGYELEQFNPAMTFTVPKERVARIHRIMRQTDFLF